MAEQTLAKGPGGWLWSRNPLAWLLWPLSLLFCALVLVRKAGYRRGLFTSHRLARPVIVVGNISVGGNGKTPVVLSLVRILTSHGYHPGILTRGYKSDLENASVILAGGETNPVAGDEANMLAESSLCPVAVGADRVAAGKELLSHHPDIDVILSDDGLQHYALARDIEIIVRRETALGNRFCLPAGPLREPLARLDQCDLLISRDSDDVRENYADCWRLDAPEEKRSLLSFIGQRVLALAGIGFPGLFFDALRDAGLEVEAYAFPDHHEYSAGDVPEDEEDRPVLVTHKDAVKLRRFARRNIWVVPLELELSDDLQYRFLKLLETVRNG